MKNQRINRDLVEITHGMAIEQKDTMWRAIFLAGHVKRLSSISINISLRAHMNKQLQNSRVHD